MHRIKSEVIPVKYSDAKQLARDYQMAKIEVEKAFENSGFGRWIVRIRLKIKFLNYFFVFRQNQMHKMNL